MGRRQAPSRSPAPQSFPDTVLPVQLLKALPHQIQPERRLMIAVFEDAVWCLRKYRAATQPSQKRLFRDACEWMTAEPDGNLFSFSTICEVLGIDPGSVRCTLSASPLVAETHVRRGRRPHAGGPVHRPNDGRKS